MNGKPEISWNVGFSKKTVWDHFRDFISHPIPIIVFTVVVFGVLWTFGEATIQFSGANPRGWLSYSLLIAASIATSILWNGYLYYHRVPEGFENVSVHAQHIAHLQRPLWEFHLAKTLLAQKLAPFEQELQDMEAGRHFEIAEKPESFQAYIQWASGRTENLFNMLAVASQLIINDFPTAFRSTPEKKVDPNSILSIAESLARFYGETVEFERSARRVLPSEELQELHQNLLGWSEPIRDGVRQLFQFLQQMCECDFKGENHIKFEIVFDEPSGVSQFCNELDRLEPHIEEIELNW